MCPETPRRRSQPVEKCKQTRKPLFTSTIFDLLECAAPRGYASSPNAGQTLKITDIHNSGPVVKNHTLSKTEGKYDATRTTACLWLFRTCPLDLLDFLGSPWVRRQHRNRRRHCKMSKSIAGTLHGRHAFHSMMSFSFMLSLHCALHPSRTPCHDVTKDSTPSPAHSRVGRRRRRALGDQLRDPKETAK